MLRLIQVTKTYGDLRAVDAVDLEIPGGQMVGIIGRSGAGKSTLLRLVKGLVHPTDGRIMWGEEEVSGLRGRALRMWHSRCSIIFQQFNLVARLNVLTNVLMGRLAHTHFWLSLLNHFSRHDRSIAIHALERVDMAHRPLQRVDTLSGGQQQRTAIARALVQQPVVILADEPIASLDPRSAERVMSILRKINQEDGITVMCNLHTVDTARKYCDRIIGMRDGVVVFDGDAQQLDVAQMRHIYGLAEDEEFDESITSTHIQDDAVRRCSTERVGEKEIAKV